MPKMAYIYVANSDQCFFDFRCQKEVQNEWFWYPKSYGLPETSLKRPKRLPRWLEKLANGSKTRPIGLQDAPEGVQKDTKLRPRSSCDGDNDKPSMQNSQFTPPMSHFLFNISQFLTLHSTFHDLKCTIQRIINPDRGSLFMIFSWRFCPVCPLSKFMILLYNFRTYVVSWYRKSRPPLTVNNSMNWGICTTRSCYNLTIWKQQYKLLT